MMKMFVFSGVKKVESDVNDSGETRIASKKSVWFKENE